MADATRDQDAPDAKELAGALVLMASSIRRKLIGRLDARLERSLILTHGSGNEAREALAHAARSVHPDLEPLARQLGRLLALGTDALSVEHLRVLAQAGFQRTASRFGELRAQQTNAADLSAMVRRHPIAALLAAMVAGYALGRTTK